MKQYTWTLLAALLIAVAGCAPSDGNGAPEANSAPEEGSAVEESAVPAGDVTFASAIQPIIAEKCAGCHVEEQKGGLSLASLESALAGGKKGGDIVAGDGEGSLLYQMVAGLAEKRMPPKGDPLTDDQIATIKAWIDGGAK